MRRDVLVLVGVALAACEPPEVSPPDAVVGTWVGTCESGEGGSAGALDVRIAIAAQAPPEVTLGGAQLKDGAYRDCAGFAVERCDIVIDGTLEGAIHPELNSALDAFSSFNTREGETLTTEITVMQSGAIFAAEFVCTGHGLVAP